MRERPRFTHLPAVLGLAALVLITFRALPGFEFVALDDDAYVTANPQVRAGLTLAGLRWALTAFVAGNWHPLTLLSHMLDVSLFGLRPAGHHAVSLLLHLANTLLVYALLARSTGARWRAAAVAALFGVHPLHVESVAWVAERKDVLSTLFGLLAALAYVGYARSGTLLRYLGVAVLLALGLAAKPMLVTLPLVLLLLDFWPLGRWQGAGAAAAPRWRRLVAEKVPLLLLAAGSAAVTIAAQAAWGAVESTAGRPLGQRAANAVVSYGWYLLKTVAPGGLALPYPVPRGGWPAWLPLAVGAALAAATALALRSARSRPFLLAGWLWYLVTLVPVIGLVQVGTQARADRYTYVPLIGLFLAAAWGAGALAATTAARRAVGAAAVAAIAVLSALSTAQSRVWHDSPALLRHSVAVLGETAPALVNLGAVLMSAGDRAEAVALFERAERLEPGNGYALYNLGLAAAYEGRTADALARFEAALGRVNNPQIASRIENHRGELLLGADEPAAIESFRRSAALNPENAAPRYNLGNWQLRTGRYPDAVASYTEVVRLQPEHAWARTNLAFAYAALGRTDEAVGALRAAVELSPGLAIARYNLGNLLLARGDLAGAGQHLREAVRLDPALWQASECLGNLLLRLGDAPGAAEAYRKALAVRPGDPGLRSRLEAATRQAP